MVDFAKLMDSDRLAHPLDPIEIFDQLPKSKHISNLYDSQASILRAWYEEMRDKRDVVIELNTGGGKTLIGLLIALSTMRETGMGVLYLVENRQLVSQVVSQGMELDIPIRAYAGRESLDATFDNGECIVVGSYQALFNGMSVFGIRGGSTHVEVGGIVVDDAHASLEAVRDAFSLTISAELSMALYKTILSEFRTAFESLEQAVTYDEFYSGTGGLVNDRVVEIPFWEWAESYVRIASKLNSECNKRMSLTDDFSNSLKFNWPLIKDNLKYCQICISRRAITISALYPLVHLFPTFTESSRRVFMSATITDYGDMVRAYDLRSLKNDAIIAPNTPAGIGRRMILPLKDDISKTDEFSALIAREISAGNGVVRLVPKSGIDENWNHPEIEEPIGHEQVEPIVRQLRSGECHKLVSFVNRYNGIDLPDDSCRILIMRDLPTGRNDSEELMARYLSRSSINTQRISQRIEQGIGRGVRSGSDHCVVLLEGAQLIDWVHRNRNKLHFSAALRAQIDMGEQTYRSIKTVHEYCETMQQDLSSEASWKAYHSEMLSQAIKQSNSEDDRFGSSFDAACAERRAFACWREHQVNKGITKLRNAAEQLCDDRQMRGWLLQLAARMCFDGSSRNATAADSIQREAHSSNAEIPYYPFAMTPQACNTTKEQAAALLDELTQGNLRAGLLHTFDTRLESLIAKAPEKQFLLSLTALGRYLGFDSHKHDKNGIGSDVTWITPDGVGFVIEAKNEKNTCVPFHKAEAGQLRTARDWFTEQHPNLNTVPVSVHPNAVADMNASASNLYALTLTKLDELKEETRRLVEKGIECLSTHNIDELANYINSQRLFGEGIIDSYLVRFNSLDDTR